MEDGSLCLVLDYEKLLADVIPQALVDIEEETQILKSIEMPEKLKNGLVLVAEDSKTAQTHLIQIFKNANIRMKLFENGQKLIDYINSLGENVDDIVAVITDIEMPEMSGFTVVNLLKKNPITSGIPIIVNSSMTGDNNKREAQSLGADGFINKTKSQEIIPSIIQAMKAKGLA